MMRPRIKMPRRTPTNQPLSRRHKRNLSYAFVAAFIFAFVYVFNGPGDPFGVPFYRHEAYMNDRANVVTSSQKAHTTGGPRHSNSELRTI